jgi:hypothetical protein
MTVASASGGVAKVEGAEQMTARRSERELGFPGGELCGVGDFIGGEQFFQVVEFLDAVAGADVVAMPLGPVAAVGLAGCAVVWVTEVEVASVQWTIGRADGVEWKLGLDKIPTGAKGAGG